ncbi:peptidase [Biscogniauxia marginata]|nr:peptidase [Biscogniauxia marginata]
MRIQSALAVLGALASASAVVAADAQDKTADVDESIIPGAYIVEFEGDDDPQAFYQGLGGQGIEVEHRMDLKYKLFKGASFNLRNATEPEVTASKIVADSRVRSIWPVRKLSFPKPNVTLVGNATALARHVKRQDAEEKPYAPHIATQVDKLLAQGYTGKGIRIGIVDTGIDYKHPALGGCFGPGCLVEYGYDLNGDNETSPVPIPDDDPYDDCMGHGTHVAGIIAAQANELGFTGAAPGVKLGMYKATGCGGYTTNELLLSGFNMAFEDGSDIISCSAGDDSGWASEPWAVAASRIAAAGVPVIVAPGNSGNSGLWNPSTPASGVNVTAIGSVENTVLPTLLKAGSYVVDNKTNDEFGFRLGSPSFQQNVTLPLWAVSNDTEAPADACEALPDSTPDLSDKIVLLRYSDDCTPNDQAANLAAKGGQWLVWYNNENNSVPDIYISNDKTKGTSGITAKQGAEFITALNEGSSITVTIQDNNSAGIYVEDFENSAQGGYTDRTSSWGPTWEIEVKPQLTTPGGNILSTYPLRLGAYAVLSGTSMSTPLASAIFALIGEARGTLDPQTLRNLLASTAKPKAWFDGMTAHDILAPVAQQGAGLAQAYDAAFATTILGVSSISFNDSDHFVAERTFTVQNTGDEDVTYVLGHNKALTVNTLSEASGILATTSFPPPTADAWAEITFASDSVTVPAGATGEVRFTLTPPAGLNATLLPVYSGYITLNSTRGEALSLPYLGVLGSLHDTPTVQPGWNGGTYLSTSENHFRIPAAANRTFTVNRPGDNNSTGVVFPVLVAYPTMGAPTLRADVVALEDTGLPTTEWLGYQIVGSLPGFPTTLVPRNGYLISWNGPLEDGAAVPEGSYKFVVSAVRVFGDAEKEEDWVAVETVPFILKYKA